MTKTIFKAGDRVKINKTIEKRVSPAEKPDFNKIYTIKEVDYNQIFLDTNDYHFRSPKDNLYWFIEEELTKAERISLKRLLK